MSVKRIAVAAALSLIAISGALAAGSPHGGFRGWAHVKSMVITDKAHGLYGFHNVYADPAALKALKGGTSYPEGARFAVSFYEVTTDGAMLGQGKKLMDTFMVRERTAKATGGWSFSASGPDGKPLAIDPAKACYDCHAAGAKATELVFSKYVE